MNISTKLLQAAAGSAAAGGATTDVTDVFSTFLYEGNGGAQKIENGIQLGAASTDNVALHMTGATSTDNGPLSLTVNSIGNATTSTTQTKFTSKSLYVDGTGSGDSTTCFDIQEGQIKLAKKDFTIEYWVYYNSHNSYGDLGSWNYYVSGYNGNFRMGIGGSGTNINIFAYDAQSSLGSVSGTVSVSTGTWYHVAISRSNGTAYLFLDGTLKASGAFDHDLTDAEIGGITLGKISAYEQVDAYFSDFRITVGAARYTSSFTAPSAALPVDSGTSGEGGLVWMKSRTGTDEHTLMDTEIGTGSYLISHSTNQAGSTSNVYITSYNSNGFSIGAGNQINRSGEDFVSWTFRNSPMFQCLTYSGDSNSSRAISHSLGSTPGMIIIKTLNSNDSWNVFHRGLENGLGTGRLFLDLTNSVDNNTLQFLSANSSSVTFANNAAGNYSGNTYVMYLFAHHANDGSETGFGPDGDSPVISCGSYTGGSGNTEINLGFEPQFLMIKRTDSAEDWLVLDTMRGLVVSGDDVASSGQKDIMWNSNAAEATPSYAGVSPQPNGFKVRSGLDALYSTNGGTYIYMAIRRGSLFPPEDATKVFAIDEMDNSPTAPPTLYSGFPVDMAFYRDISTTSNTNIHSRLTGTGQMQTNRTSAETSYSFSKFDYMDGWFSYAGAQSNYYSWMWKRAPSYFDVVAYSGTGSARTISHNLGAVPEMIWVKGRSQTGSRWAVYHKDIGNTKYLFLNEPDAASTFNAWQDTTPSSSVFSLSTWGDVNGSGETFIAYLFATVAGVSKVGSYTGNGSSSGPTVDCGFSGSPRFVLIKKATGGTGSWYVFDSVRGIVAGAESQLYLNSTAAEQTATDQIDPTSSGFQIVINSGGLNTNGETYIFYAIA